MSHRYLFPLLLLLSSAPAGAAVISVGTIDNITVADTVIAISGSSACESSQTQANCDFLAPSPTTYLNRAGVAGVVTSNPATYVLSPFRNSAYIDLGLSSGNFYNGAGNDAVVFIVGHSTSFGFQAFDQANNPIFNGISTYNVPTPVYDSVNGVYTDIGDTVLNTDGSWYCISPTNSCSDGTALSAAFFDFGDAVAGDTPISRIRIYLGEDYNGPTGTRPRFSLAGGFYTSPTSTVVPLPLPAFLFASGLGLLGWLGRRRSR